MNENEKNYATEICEILNQLKDEDCKHLLWIGQGILFASTYKDGRTN